MRTTKIVLWLLATAAAILQGAMSYAGPSSPPVLVVLPNDQETLFGNTAVAYPWNLSASNLTSLRYQQVYAAAGFAGAAGMITQLGFRVAAAAENGIAFNPVTISNVVIVLSTTSAPVGGLSAAFATNTGPDAVTVFQGNLMLSSADVIPPGVHVAPLFDTRVYLQTPFYYNPTGGNLLLDVKIGANVLLPLSCFDGQNTGGGSISRAWAFPDGATTATALDSAGIITQFMFGSTSPAIQSGIHWLLAESNYKNISNANPPVAAANFNNSQTYILSDSSGGAAQTSVPGGWSSIGGVDFKSLADLETALENGALGFASTSSNLEAVLYDNESWTNTPYDEQTNAAVCESLFANLAHAYGYTFISTPALDIMNVQPENCSGPDWQKYLQCGVPTRTFPVFSAAAPSDIYEIQAQTQIEGITTNDYPDSTYNELVSGAAAQALAANPNVAVFAGINVQTSEEANPASLAQMYEAIINCAAAGVSGYWFNCGSANAVESAQVLQLLDTSPVIVTQPTAAATNLQAGASVTWNVLAAGAGPITYQWYQAAANIPVAGATNASYTFSNATVSTAYFCVASNSYGITVSSNVAVQVSPLAAPGFVTNASGPFTLSGDGAGRLNFSGTASTTYRVWGSTHLLLTPVTNTWTLLGSGIFSGGHDSMTIPLTNTLMFYVITQP